MHLLVGPPVDNNNTPGFQMPLFPHLSTPQAPVFPQTLAVASFPPPSPSLIEPPHLPTAFLSPLFPFSFSSSPSDPVTLCGMISPSPHLSLWETF